jgi:GH25 family lysozyme M1 (1,4-beta-N-acetylmuramidase)
VTAICRGLDVSAYQNPQDWAGHKADGVVFAFAKASEGQHSRDDAFAKHIVGIVKAGLVPGAYHFGWPTQDAAVEAANYVAAVKPYATAGFLHWLDLERRSDGANYQGRTTAQIKAWATTWLAAVRAAFPGQRVGVYTSGSDLDASHVPAGTTVWYPAYSWGYTAVSYPKAEAAARPRPSGWSPLFWQFTSTPIDRSICYLSEAGLRTWAAGNEDSMAGMTKQDVHDAVWKIDDIAAGSTEKDPKNTTWQPQSFLKATFENTVKIAASEAAQTAAITAMAAALGKVDEAIDPAALVDEVKAAIAAGVSEALAGIDIHVTTS